MASAAITVWGIGTPRTMRVYWTLHELAITYTTRPVRTRTPDMDGAEFLTVSPGSKIPALQHGALTITESGAIIQYLFETFDPIARAPAQNATVNRWSYFALMELDATALYVIRRHRDLATVYGAAPVAVDAAKAYFKRQITVVDKVLADDRDFLAGDALSAADIHLVTCCDWAVHCALELPSAVAAYHARHRQRAAYSDAITVNYSR